ncbi:unnamed protein product [Sphagnum compactum]
MAPALLRVSRSERGGDDHVTFLLQELSFIRESVLNPRHYHSRLVEQFQGWIGCFRPRSRGAAAGSSSSSSGGYQNVRISFAAAIQCPSVMPMERRSSILYPGDSEPALLLKNFMGKIRIPCLDDTVSSEAANTAINHIFAGTMARTLSQVCGHPVDTVKTRMQIREPTKKLRKWKKKIISKHIGIGPVGVDNWFFKGPADLYRGVTGAILGTVPNALLYFAVYETSTSKLEKYLPKGAVHVVSASMGTIVASIVRVPADTLKHRVQAYMHPNVFEAFRSVVTAEGIGGLYKGFWPTLLRDVPEIAIQFGVYEKLRGVVQAKRNVTKLTTPEHLALGACAGAIAATITMPLDLVKTHQQCGIGQGIPRIVMSVMEEKGAAGLFTGVGARALHVSLMSALFFGLFEYCKMVMKPDRIGLDKLLLPKIWSKRRTKIWKRQFIRH